MDYTPTTEEVREAFASRFWDDYSVYQPTEEDLGEERANFDRWLAEELRKAKAEAWEEGAVWQRENAVPDDRRMKVRFVSELQAVNPYRQGENK